MEDLNIKLPLMYFANYNEIISLDPTVYVTQACEILYQSYFTSAVIDEFA